MKGLFRYDFFSVSAYMCVCRRCAECFFFQLSMNVSIRFILSVLLLKIFKFTFRYLFIPFFSPFKIYMFIHFIHFNLLVIAFFCQKFFFFVFCCIFVNFRNQFEKTKKKIARRFFCIVLLWQKKIFKFCSSSVWWTFFSFILGYTENWGHRYVWERAHHVCVCVCLSEPLSFCWKQKNDKRKYKAMAKKMPTKPNRTKIASDDVIFLSENYRPNLKRRKQIHARRYTHVCFVRLFVFSPIE